VTGEDGPVDGVPRLDDRTAHNRATYDRIAESYLRRQHVPLPEGRSPLEGVLEEYAATLAPGSQVADLGAGPGIQAAALRRHGHQVVAVDLSRVMLLLGVGGVVGDLRRLPLRTAALDGVWSCAALLHVPDADTGLVLAGVRRVLRPGGVLGLVTALGEGVVEEPVPYAPGESRWFVYRDAEALVRLLEDAHLRVTASGEVPGNRRWGWWRARAV
jgi:SAM-dependent methyltransferase